MLNLLRLANPMSVIPYSSASFTAKSVGAAMLITIGIPQKKIAFYYSSLLCAYIIENFIYWARSTSFVPKFEG